MQCLVNDALIGWPVAGDQCQVDLVGLTLTKLLLQQLERHAPLGNQQDAAGFAVQAMDQLQKIGIRPGHAQLLDDTKTHAAAAMHGHARWFVNGQYKVVFKQDGKFSGRCITPLGGTGAVAHDFLRGGHGLGFLIGPFRGAHRRQAHHVASFNACVSVRSALVDPHLAAADDAVNVGLGHALQMADQKVVEPLAGVVFINRYQAGLRSGFVCVNTRF